MTWFWSAEYARISQSLICFFFNRHTLSKLLLILSKIWTPQEKRNRGRPRRSWRIGIDNQIRKKGLKKALWMVWKGDRKLEEVEERFNLICIYSILSIVVFPSDAQGLQWLYAEM